MCARRPFGRRRSRRCAFTLVELLVVIGIIAVLVGILMPALAAARRQSQQTKCLAALREIGNGFAMYAAAFKGYWPCAVHDFGCIQPTTGGYPNPGQPWLPLPTGRQLRWQDRLLPFITDIKNIDDYKDLADPTKISQDALRSSSVLWGCPTYRLQDGWNNTNTIDDQVRNGYSMNVYPELPAQATNKFKPYIQGTTPPFQYSLATSNQAGRYYKATEWSKSSDRLLLGEGLAYFIQMSPVARVATTFNPKIHYWWPFDNTTQLDASANQWENNTYFWVEGSRHGPRDATKPMTYNRPYMNALFCDGHAAQVSVKQAWQAICDPGGKNAPNYP